MKNGQPKLPAKPCNCSFGYWLRMTFTLPSTAPFSI